MQTTYIIGNGFDVNLGIKSTYGDFYQYYVGLPAVGNQYIMNVRQQMTNYITNNTNKEVKDIDWSDLEKALGDYSINIPADEFKTVFFDIETNLMAYLTRQADLLEINDKMKQKIMKDFCWPDINDNFKPGPINSIRNHKTYYRNGSEMISIINFNYTSTLERLLDYKGGRVSIGTNSVGMSVYIENIIHIHRSLADGDIILGVNDVNQIANQSYLDRAEILDCLVKPQVNENQEDGINDEVRNVIHSSDIIVIFGSSLGETDSMWWTEIGERLLNSKALLLYFMYSKTAITRGMYNLPGVIRDKRNELAKKMFITDSQFQTVEKRILIGYRPKIFSVLMNQKKSS